MNRNMVFPMHRLTFLAVLLAGCSHAPSHSDLSSKEPPPDIPSAKADGGLTRVDAGELEFGALIEGAVEVDQLRSWHFSLFGPATVSCATSAPASGGSLDTIAYLHEGEREVEVDDDGGTGLYSAFEVSLDAGDYTVDVMGYAGRAGEFALRCDCEGTGCEMPSIETNLALNDVSILVPSPDGTQDRASFLWLLPREGELGPGFPGRIVEHLPPLVADTPDLYGSTLVVGIRFDPCAQVALDDACSAEIRLVAQPVVIEAGSEPFYLDDAAVHLFYSVDEDEVDRIVEQLTAIAARSPVPTDGPLRVHPGLAEENLTGPTSDAVRRFVVEHCRQDNLFRVTTNTFAFDNWTFSRFEWDGESVTQADLAHLTSPATSQSWFRMAGRDDLDDPSGTISPSGVDDFRYLLDLTNYASPQPARLEAAVENLNRIENPRLRTNEMTDCVGCHLSTQTRIFAERQGIDFAGETQYVAPEGIDTTLSLVEEMQGNLNSTIAFGYHTLRRRGVEVMVPSISHRVIFESAEVLRELSERPGS